jgi:hypothetical protein
MQTNALPRFDDSVNTTGCCPKFNPEGWDDQDLHFENMRFVQADTLAVAHIPVNMGKVFTRVQNHITDADAQLPEGYLVLSKDVTAFRGEHLFAVSRDVPGEKMITLSGDFITRVFEGPYRRAKDWYDEMQQLARDRGKTPKDVYFFYTTCPKCAKAYGQNYVIGLVSV